MTSGIFDCYQTAKAQGQIDLINDDIVAVLILSGYIPDFVNDSLYTDIPEVSILSETLLLGKLIEDKKFKAVAVDFGALESGQDVQGVLLYKDARYIEDTLLLAYFDFSVPGETTTDNIVVQWHADGIFNL